MADMSERLSKKLAFVGTNCVGRTALLEAYRQRYGRDRRFAFVEDAAQLCLKDNATENRFSEQTGRTAQSLALKNEGRAQRHGILRTFCDRSVLDAPAYLFGLGDFDGSRRLVERVSFWLASYTSIALLNPNDIDYRPDEAIDITPETRQRLHEGFLSLFSEYQIDYQFVSGTIPERVEQIDQIADIRVF